MSEELKTLMHETADLDFAMPDVAAIARAGDRRVRRNRVVIGVAGLAAAAVVAGGVAVTTGRGDGPSQVAADPVAEVTWVAGQILHTPSSEVDLGHPVLQYSTTSEGVVFQSTDGVVYQRRDDQSVEIGRISRDGSDDEHFSAVVADQEAGVVGWVEYAGDSATFVVHTLASGEERRFPAQLPSSRTADQMPPMLFAIDDGKAYWSDAAGVRETTIATGQSTVLFEQQETYFITAVQNGRMTLLTDVDPADGGVEVAEVGGRTLLGPAGLGEWVSLSPDGRWAATTAGSVWDVDSGKRDRLDLDIPAGHEAAAFGWLDDNTVVVLEAEAAGEGEHARMFTCEVPDGACALAVDDVDYTKVVLPTMSATAQLRGGEGTSSEGTDSGEAPPVPSSTDR